LRPSAALRGPLRPSLRSFAGLVSPLRLFQAFADRHGPSGHSHSRPTPLATLSREPRRPLVSLTRPGRVFSAFCRPSRPFTADHGRSPFFRAVLRWSHGPLRLVSTSSGPSRAFGGLRSSSSCPGPTAAIAVVCARFRSLRSWTALYSSRPFVAPRSFSRTNSCDGTREGHILVIGTPRGAYLYIH
jgi:hypothetical protein